MMLVPPPPRSSHDCSSSRGEIGDEIRLPHVVAVPDHDEIAFAVVILVLAHAVGELAFGVEDEALVVEDIHDERHVRGADAISARFSAAAVEMAMLALSGIANRLRGPIRSCAWRRRRIELRRAGAFEHVDHLLIEMALRRDGPPGGISNRNMLAKSPRPLRWHRRRFDAERGHGAVSTANRSQPKSSSTGTPSLDPVEIGVDAIARRQIVHELIPCAAMESAGR